jgi:hypothetical protein
VISEETVRDILSRYEKFGWHPERVLLSPEVKSVIERFIQGVLENTSIVTSDLDAVWFSRPAANGRIAWELRSLGPDPFALVDSLEPDAAGSELTELFERVENQMRQRLIRPARSH